MACPAAHFAQLAGEEPVAPRRGSAEQSNTSIIFGDKLIMKLFRRQQPGPNPDTEIGRFITESTHFTHIAPFAGSIEYLREGQEPSTLAMLQGLVRMRATAGSGRWKSWTATTKPARRRTFPGRGIRGASQPAAVESSAGDRVRPRARRHISRCRCVAGPDEPRRCTWPSPRRRQTLRSCPKR